MITPRDPLTIAATGLSKLVHDYSIYAKRVSRVEVWRHNIMLMDPPVGVFKVNVDAHKVNNGGCGLGVAIRNGQGEIVGMA